jgi:membrane associated rhomboid family serine protease
MDALKGFKIIAGLAIFMVALQVINAATGYSLMAFGLVPRTVHGLLGIVTSPFLHVSFSHLSANLVAFLVLGTLVMVEGLNRFMAVSAIIILLGGCSDSQAYTSAPAAGFSGCGRTFCRAPGSRRAGVM